MSKKWVYDFNRRSYGRDRRPVTRWDWIVGVGLLVVIAVVVIVGT